MKAFCPTAPSVVFKIMTQRLLLIINVWPVAQTYY